MLPAEKFNFNSRVEQCPTRAIPQLSLLTPDQIAFIHQSVLKILGVSGVRVRLAQRFSTAAEKARFNQSSRGAGTFPAEIVEWAMQAAPAAIDVYKRSGELAFRLGADRMRFGIGVTSLYYQDPLTDEFPPLPARTCGHGSPGRQPAEFRLRLDSRDRPGLPAETRT